MNTRFLIVASFLLFTSSVFGQRVAEFWWFDTGVKFGYGATGLYNSSIWDRATSDWEFDISTGYSFGAKLGINKGTSGFTIDVMFANAEQSFEDHRNPTEVRDYIVEWNTVDLYTLYRNNRQLGYVEIGPKFSFVNDVLSGYASEPRVGVADNYASNNIGAVLGFGAYFIGGDNAFSGILGLRFEYGFTDFVNPDGHLAGHPVPDVNVTNPGVSTAPVFAGIVFELNWGLGYYGKASCGSRSKFIKF